MAFDLTKPTMNTSSPTPLTVSFGQIRENIRAIVQGDSSVFSALRVDGNAVITGTVKERGRATAMGEFTTYTPSVTTSAGTWTAATYPTARYAVVGKKYTLMLVMSGTTSAANQPLTVSLGGGYTVASAMLVKSFRVTGGVDSDFVCQFSIGSGSLSFYGTSGGASIPAGTHTFYLDVSFEVQ